MVGMDSGWFEGWSAQQHDVNGVRLFARVGGRPIDDETAPVLLLLHGFPQTHAMWHRVGQLLAPHFRLVVADLRGYGDSSKPPGDDDHGNYSKRVMASDLVQLMQQLGHRRFSVCGHDRGGRVAHRMALDHPECVDRLCVIDIVPTLLMYERTDMAFAQAYYHWFHLIQPAPLPERMIGGNPRYYLHAKLGGWGSDGLGHIEPAALLAYERAFCNALGIHAACEDYRASASIDLEQDRRARQAGRKVACPVHVLWGERGVVHRLFSPIADWSAFAEEPASGELLPAGHFIPEELPQATADALLRFMRADSHPAAELAGASPGAG
ncbi:MAG: alpha/beta fold hydrolase [Leptothrix sp. (in: b-proteobacteria)]